MKKIAKNFKWLLVAAVLAANLAVGARLWVGLVEQYFHN